MNHCLLLAPGAVPPATSASSATFIDDENGQQVSSQVQVYATTDQAASARQSAGSNGVSACLQSELTATMPKTLPKEESLRHVKVTGNAVPGLAAGEFSQQVAVLVTYPTGNGGSGGTETFTDVIGFASGSALVEAQFESTGSPPPEVLERQVMAALKARAANGG